MVLQIVCLEDLMRFVDIRYYLEHSLYLECLLIIDFSFRIKRDVSRKGSYSEGFLMKICELGKHF